MQTSTLSTLATSMKSVFLVNSRVIAVYNDIYLGM